VEANQAFRNVGGGTFASRLNGGSYRQWARYGMADLDNDGDLDGGQHLRSSAQLFENRCAAGPSEVDLHWAERQYPRPRRAVILHTSAGTYTRDVRAGSGYLSGDLARVHLAPPGPRSCGWRC
jgi:hypothetical protein